jgi:hypothetical protein
MWWGELSRTSKKVRKVKLALHMYEASLCSCGHSGLLSHGYEGAGEYEAKTVTCHACAAKERAKKTDTPGLKTYAEDLHDTPYDADEDGETDDEPEAI